MLNSYRLCVPTARLYFDPVSPYSYLALSQAEGFAEEHELSWEPRPVLYAALLDHHGLVGPVESDAKRRYTFGDVLRCALRLGLPLIGLGQPRDHARLLAWYLAATACFFVLYAGPDWMDGFRWLNMGIVPISVIFAELAEDDFTGGGTYFPAASSDVDGLLLRPVT